MICWFSKDIAKTDIPQPGIKPKIVNKNDCGTKESNSLNGR